MVLLLRAEGGPGQAADDDVGVPDAPVGEHVREAGGVRVDHLDRGVPGGQSGGQPRVDLDRQLAAVPGEPFGDGPGHRPGAGAQLDDDGVRTSGHRCGGDARQ